MIDRYRFGSIVVDGREYESDVLIYPDGHVDDAWWRVEGHKLILQDLQQLIASKPDAIVVVTGESGMLAPDPGLRDQLAKHGIALYAESSEEAMVLYNELSRDRKVAGCFHLTC